MSSIDHVFPSINLIKPPFIIYLYYHLLHNLLLIFPAFDDTVRSCFSWSIHVNPSEDHPTERVKKNQRVSHVSLSPRISWAIPFRSSLAKFFRTLQLQFRWLRLKIGYPWIPQHFDAYNHYCPNEIAWNYHISYAIPDVYRHHQKWSKSPKRSTRLGFCEPAVGRSFEQYTTKFLASPRCEAGHLQSWSPFFTGILRVFMGLSWKINGVTYWHITSYNILYNYIYI